MVDNPSTDPVHDRIRERLVAVGKTPHAASLEAGFDKSYLRKLLERPGSRPGGEALAELSIVLQTTPDYILGRDERPTPPPSSGAISIEPIRMPDNLAPVPVRGTVAGSHESGAFQFDGSDVDFIERYPALARRPRVYALYVEGDSMAPAHMPGHVRFVDPAAPVRPGDTVVLSIIDLDRGLYAVLGNLVSRGEMVIIGKLNPQREIKFHRTMVHAIHHVLTDNELAGKG